MFKKCLKNKNGFTLLELTISSFIIALIAGAFLANYHLAQNSSKLKIAAQKLVSDIRLAQSYSLGSKEFQGSTVGGGWGIYFDINSPNFYIMFADINEDHSYNNPGERYKQINLPSGIIIKSINLGNPLNVVFEPPKPTVYLNNNSSAQASIELTDGKNIKTVSINFFGLAEVID